MISCSGSRRIIEIPKPNVGVAESITTGIIMRVIIGRMGWLRVKFEIRDMVGDSKRFTFEGWKDVGIVFG